MVSKLKEAKTKAHDFSASKKILQVSLYDILNLKSKLEYEVSELKDDLVETFDIYFEREKEQVALLHSELDLSHMDIFKVVCDDQ